MAVGVSWDHWLGSLGAFRRQHCCQAFKKLRRCCPAGGPCGVVLGPAAFPKPAPDTGGHRLHKQLACCRHSKLFWMVQSHRNACKRMSGPLPCGLDIAAAQALEHVLGCCACFDYYLHVFSHDLPLPVTVLCTACSSSAVAMARQSICCIDLLLSGQLLLLHMASYCQETH